MDAQLPLAGSSSNSPAEYDAYDIQQEVNAFASLISSREVMPPLSIGLFGTEGSLNSYFSYRLADRISEIASRVEPDDLTSSAYFSRIVQIRYNAWHYMSANQWLGLAEKIFVELAQLEADRRGDRVFIPISTAERLRRELESKLEHSENVHRDAEAEMMHATDEYDAAVRVQADNSARSKWAEVQKVFNKKISSEMANEIDKAGKVLGLKHLSRNVERLNEVLDQAKSLGPRAGLLTSSLKIKTFNTVLSVIGLVLIVVFAGLAVGLYVSDPKAWLEVIGKGVTAFATILGFVGVLIAAIRQNRASKAINVLEDCEVTLKDAIQEVDRGRKYEEIISEEKVAYTSGTKRDNYSRLAAASREVLLAGHEVKDFLAGGALRAVSEYYRRLIRSGDLSASAVPAIREDFESLSRAITASSFAREDEGPALFERIVVYIDDLDQCPLDVAITVLQAAYLLLSFPLFVVVIVADPLSLLESLQLRYRTLKPMPEEADDSQDDTDSSMRGLNFLHKLIQIPFWVRRPDAAGARRFVNNFGPTKDSVVASPITAAVSEPETEPRAASSGSVEYSNWQETTQEEIVFLSGISRFYDSPRDLKRLVNTYRLLRSSLAPDQLGRFAGTENSSNRGYAAVITELTILIVAPLAAPHFFRGLTQSESNDLDQLVSQFGVVDNVVSSRDRNLIRAILEEYQEYIGDLRVLDDLRAWSPITTRYSLNAGSRLLRRIH